MKLVTFEIKDKEGFGALVEDGVIDLRHMDETPGVSLEEIPRSTMDFLRLGDAAIEAAKKTVQYITGLVEEGKRPSEVCKLSDVTLKAPVPRPSKLFCLATNYQEHAEEVGTKSPPKEKMTPRVFMKPPTNTVIGPEQPIVIPKNGNNIDWECELAVVMGKKARFVRADEAYDYVAGYTVLNDVSERRLKIDKEREPREGDRWFDWLNGKWFDTFAPMGPCLVLKDEIPNPHNLRITLRVNGETKQDSNTGNMIFTIDELIEFISSLVTLEPGDVISTGTPSGVGGPSGTFLKPGDVVEAEVENIGILRNPVKAE